ncbi:MAG: cell division protein FtsZ [Sediminibacterium sp.]|nr:cell division protein FtsZ [Sediminibacterium sp.]
MIQFDLPKQKSSIIKVLGVGGGGSNAVNFMFKQDIEGVDFIICNTDSKAIEQSDVPNKIQLGPHLTQGLGAGADPSVGKLATEESLEEIRKILEVNTRMAFITVGMGGGTGTGGAPIIAKICKDLGILTVGIVTTPFGFEGPRRQKQAEEGINQLKPLVDTLLVISNDKLRVQYGNLKMKEAFTKADNVLATAAKCITDVINSRGHIIVDFADVCTVMKNGGVAILGKAEVEGENRAERAIEEALNSPLLNDNDIKGAKWILLNINSAEGEHECTMDELETINNFLRERTGEHSDVIMGMGYDATLDKKLGITLIATGFEGKDPFKTETPKKAEAPIEEKIVMTLVTDAVAAEQIKQEPVSNEVNEKAEDHFILDQTEETPIHFSFDQAPAIEAPLLVAEEELAEEEIKEVVLDKYDTIWELNAEASIAAADSIEEAMEEDELEELEEDEMLASEEEVEEEMEVMAFENNDLMPTLVLEEEPAFEEEVEVAMEEEIDELVELHLEEEVEEEMFTLNMEAEKEATIVSDFILSKPTNIYVEEADEVEEEFSAPVVASNEVIFEVNETDSSVAMEEDFMLEEITIEEEVEETLIEEEFIEEELMGEELMEEELMEAEMTIDENIAEEEVATVEMYTAPVIETPAPAEVVFESSFRYEEEPSMQLVMREESNTPVAHVNQQANYDMPLDNAEEQRRKVAERIQKLRNLSFNINNVNDSNNDFESVPAYVRRNMEMFGNTLASVENYYSKYTVDKDENNQTQISTINTFMDGKKPD